MLGMTDIVAVRSVGASQRWTYHDRAPWLQMIGLSTLQYRFDSFYHAFIEMIDHLTGIHILAHLLRF